MNDTRNSIESKEVKEKLLDISDMIKGLKFKRKVVGGVDILDVWRKLSQVDKGYQVAMLVQKQYYEDKLHNLENELERLRQPERECTIE